MMGTVQQVDPFLSTQYEMNALTIDPYLYAMNWQTIDPFLSTHYVMDEKTIPHFLAGTGTGLSTGNEAMVSVNTLIETEVIPPELANYVLNPNWMAAKHQKELGDESQSPQSGKESVNKPEVEDEKCTLQGDADDVTKSYALC
ncbi:hypothetical protein QYF36_008599 [Acer negundo]|nr:hypothetical protein QYF36_008599 [Acer negundo]